MSNKSLTTEELHNKIGKLTAELSELFDKNLGEDSYSCYVNICWDQPVVSQADSMQKICLVCTPEIDSPSYESISPLTKSLASDPFLNHVIIYNFTNALLTRVIPSDNNEVKTMGKFKQINSIEGVN